jgi:hypothetical protein
MSEASTYVSDPGHIPGSTRVRPGSFPETLFAQRVLEVGQCRIGVIETTVRKRERCEP